MSSLDGALRINFGFELYYSAAQIRQASNSRTAAVSKTSRSKVQKKSVAKSSENRCQGSSTLRLVFDTAAVQCLGLFQLRQSFFDFIEVRKVLGRWSLFAVLDYAIFVDHN